ncbi:MAG: flippase [Candidatus Pacebacteria bacterium]|nr:flippase [Candidatus Paceibacterota bacterium]
MVTKIKEFLFHNKSTAQTVAKNTFWLFSGKIVGQLTRASLVIFAARILGPASWGAFSYVMSLSAFLLIFTDIGLTAIVTRESSKDPLLSKKYFSTAFLFKIILLSLGSIFLIVAAPYISKINEAVALLPVIAIMLVFDSLRNFGFSISRSQQRMQMEALNEILTNLAIIGLGFFFLIYRPSSYNLAFAYLVGTMIGFSFTFFTLKKYFMEAAHHFDNKIIKSILSASIPFALSSFLGAIMINTDLIMLGWLRSPEEVGFYSAAQKPIQLLYVAASLFATSLFPVLSRAVLEKTRFRLILEKGLAASLLISIPMLMGGIILGNQIIALLFGNDYSPAISAFKVLCLTLIIVFPSVIINNSLLAYNKQKNLITYSLLGATGNVIFNFLFIPIWGIAGAALSTVITQITANAFVWIKMNSINEFHIMGRIKKIIIASVVTAPLTMLFWSFDMNVVINIILTSIIYFSLLKIQGEELLGVLFRKQI